MGDNNQMIVSDETPTQQQPPPFDIGAIFKTVQMLTQKVTSELKPEEGSTEDGKPPDIAKVFSSIGKILSEPSREMDDVKKTFANLGKGGGGGSGSGGGGGAPGLNLGSIFSSLLKQQQPQPTDNVQATHQDKSTTQTTNQLQEPLLPVGEKTVVLEVTEQELNDGVTKKFTIDVAEKGTPSDVFALDLQLEKNKFFYKFFLKERNLNLSFLLDLK